MLPHYPHMRKMRGNSTTTTESRKKSEYSNRAQKVNKLNINSNMNSNVDCEPILIMISIYVPAGQLRTSS